MKLPARQKLALQLLMGLGVVTAISCTIRTVFSYQIKAEDKTWQGIPNALCRIFEINLGIVAANAPMMRPLWNYCKRRYRAHMLLHRNNRRNNSDNNNSNNNNNNNNTPTNTHPTLEGNMQWYHPPNRTPWYRRFRRHFQWNIRPPISQTSSTQSMNKRHSPASDLEHAEKATLPPPHPNVPKPRATSIWPQSVSVERDKEKDKDKEKPKSRSGGGGWSIPMSRGKSTDRVEKRDNRKAEKQAEKQAERERQKQAAAAAAAAEKAAEREDRDRPVNATWNKDEPADPPRPRRTSESFDLPLQGLRNEEWINEERERMREWASRKRREQQALQQREMQRQRSMGGQGVTQHDWGGVGYGGSYSSYSGGGGGGGGGSYGEFGMLGASGPAPSGGGHVSLAGSGNVSRSGSGSTQGGGGSGYGSLGSGGGRRVGHKAQPSWPLP